MRRLSLPTLVSVCLFVVTGLSACSATRAAAPLPLQKGDWVSPLERDHALTGRILDVATKQPVTEAELAKALAGADVVLLGEQHDNVDHHRLQAVLLANLVAAGRRPAVAFEQLDLEKQGAVDAALADTSGPRDPASRATALAKAVGWDKSGWPPFDQYRAIFETALRADLPIRAANLSRASLMSLFTHPPAKKGAGPRTCPTVDTSAWRDVPLADEARASMVAEIQESHCGYADDCLVTTMLEAQRRRDDAMAGAVVAALDASKRTAPARDARPGVVTVCGFAHARNDTGVPLYLRHRLASARVVSVAFLEVFPEGLAADDYAKVLHAAALPFDYVIFTPRSDNDDPCEKYRNGLEKMKQKAR